MFAEGHLDCTGFDVMLKACKLGGFCVFSTRVQYLTEYGYEEKIKSLIEEGKWVVAKEEEFTRYDQLQEQISRFKKCEVKVYALKKLK